MYSANIFKLKVPRSQHTDWLQFDTKSTAISMLTKKRLGFFVHLMAYPPDDPYYCRNSEDGNHPD